jgi:N-acetylneuraminate lyase
MTSHKIKGLVAAPFTPFHADGALHPEQIPAYVQWLQQNSVTGAFICGTTGEGMSLTVEERCEVAEQWVNHAPASLQVIVHVGHNSLDDARRLAAHAAAIGASAVASMPPSFFKPSGVAGAVRWCRELAAMAPQLPFYYYHIPSLSGVPLPMVEFLAAATDSIANFAGIKFTHENVDEYHRCVEYAGGAYDILFGRDELLLSGLRAGALGAVGSTYNFAAPLFLRLVDCFSRGDRVIAEAYQRQAVSMIEACVQGPWHPLAAQKWLMAEIGLDCGPPRLPISALSPDQQVELSNRLRERNVHPAHFGVPVLQS